MECVPVLLLKTALLRVIIIGIVTRKITLPPPPEPCEVQGIILHPTWCRAHLPPAFAEAASRRQAFRGMGGVKRRIRCFQKRWEEENS
jgi:hypothetical protein